MSSTKKLEHLGGLTSNQFLKKYWQKMPLLIREAFDHPLLDMNLSQFIKLSNNPLCSTRLITQRNGNYQVTYGPVSRKKIKLLPKAGWTILIQGINLVCEDANDLFQHFNFIPRVRMDDIMVSYAAPGGSVGAHYDSYDVFLLQGSGARNWEVSRPKDLSLRENTDLKLLRNFRPDGVCNLQKGDMLYLPPEFAHNGIGDVECFTFSVGFRTPDPNGLRAEFLDFLDSNSANFSSYSDPTLIPTLHPGMIPDSLVSWTFRNLKNLRWDQKTIVSFLGKYLTSTNTDYTESDESVTLNQSFVTRSSSFDRLCLNTKLKFLYRDNSIFINGEEYCVDKVVMQEMRPLLDFGSLAVTKKLSAKSINLINAWLKNSFIRLQK